MRKIKLRSFFACIIFTICFALFVPVFSFCAEIHGPEVRLTEGKIYVSAALSLDENYVQELRNGMVKEFTFYIDIFKVWNIWPDEFILGKSFVRTLKCDPVKKEYHATSYHGDTLTEKRFNSFDSMIQWSLSINELKIAHAREIQPGLYFVRITVESKMKKLPPIIGNFFIFLSEYEFKIKKDSLPFHIGTGK